jgi:glycogen synthase
MACGLACVATRVSGSEDVIQHGVNGLLVEVEDYQGMAQALLTLLREPALVEKYGKLSRATIEKNYSLHSTIERYAEVYERVTSGTASSRRQYFSTRNNEQRKGKTLCVAFAGCTTRELKNQSRQK